MMKHILRLPCLVLYTLLLFSGCGIHTHAYTHTTTAATCGIDGLTVSVCTCGDTKETILPATGQHNWDAGTMLLPPTCLREGKQRFTCTVCMVTRDDILPTLGGHNWGEDEIRQSATCTAPGESVRRCSLCQEEEFTPIPPTDTHTFHPWAITLAATCGAEGIESHSCTVCSLSESRPLPATGLHIWEDGQITTAPTCATEGVATFLCTACDASYTESVSRSTMHTWRVTRTDTAATCGTAGTEILACTVCQTEMSQSIPPTGQHRWDTGHVTQTATCAAEGMREYGCTVCGSRYTEAIPRISIHTWDEGKITKQPSCAEEGTYRYTCGVCGAIRQERISPTDAHTWSSTLTTPPTAQTEGILTYTCVHCTASYTERVPPRPLETITQDPHHFRTTKREDSYLDFTIDGTTLYVDGRIRLKNLEEVWVFLGDQQWLDEDSVLVQVTDGQPFSITMPLHAIDQNTYVTVCTRIASDSLYWSYSWEEIIIERQGKDYRFLYSPVLPHNMEMAAQWVNPKDCLSTVSSTIQSLAASIVGKESDPYKQMYLLHMWVVEHIYYDYDYFYGRTSRLIYLPDDVYTSRRSVCEGYARLLQALLHAQNIPALRVTAYTTSVIQSGQFNSSNAGNMDADHILVEAWLESENRWVILDPTWDSGNKYENGAFVEGSNTDKYFDIALPYLSFTHKLIEYIP